MVATKPKPRRQSGDFLKDSRKAEKRAKKSVALLEAREGGPAAVVLRPLEGNRKRQGKLIDLMGLGLVEGEDPTSKSAANKKMQFYQCEAAVHTSMDREGWTFDKGVKAQDIAMLCMVYWGAVELCPFLDRFERSWASYEIALERHQKIRKRQKAQSRRQTHAESGEDV